MQLIVTVQSQVLFTVALVLNIKTTVLEDVQFFLTGSVAGILEKATEFGSAYLANSRIAVQLEKGILCFLKTNASLYGAEVVSSSVLRAACNTACWFSIRLSYRCTSLFFMRKGSHSWVFTTNMPLTQCCYFPSFSLDIVYKPCLHCSLPVP